MDSPLASRKIGIQPGGRARWRRTGAREGWMGDVLPVVRPRHARVGLFRAYVVLAGLVRRLVPASPLTVRLERRRRRGHAARPSAAHRRAAAGRRAAPGRHLVLRLGRASPCRRRSSSRSLLLCRALAGAAAPDGGHRSWSASRRRPQRLADRLQHSASTSPASRVAWVASSTVGVLHGSPTGAARRHRPRPPCDRCWPWLRLLRGQPGPRLGRDRAQRAAAGCSGPVPRRHRLLRR